MKELESQGLIYRIQGAGSYVKERNLMHATVDSNQLELINLKKYKLKLLDFEVGQVIPKITEALNVQPYDIVYTIKRAAMATNKQLVSFQKICIPAKVIQVLNMEMMYPLIQQKLNVKPAKATREISLVHADQDLIAKGEVKGQVEEKEPLLKWLQKSYLSGGWAFEWNETYYRITKFPIKEAIVL